MEASGLNTDTELFEYYGRFINPAYPSFLRRLGLDKIAVRASGATITDSEGKTYIDCVGGYGIFNLGHNHPRIIKALMNQLTSQQLITKPFITEIPVRAAELLCKITPGDLICSFICNSGSEAIDSAIKLARLHTGENEIIAAKNSFHGYTLGALSASGIPSFRRHFGPLVPNIVHLPFGDMEALRDTVTEKTAAILMEPIQHEAGVFVPPNDYFKQIRQICDEKGVILILDEIKTGFGKTGRMFASEHFGIVPDMLVVGKSLGGGVIPIGAVISKKKLWRKFGLSFPMSASSYAANILACKAAIATIEVLQNDGLVNECEEKGKFMFQNLKNLALNYPEVVTTVNGMGLLMGVEMKNSAHAFKVAQDMIKQGVLVLPAFGNPSVLMLEPPFVITFDEIQKVLESFDKACEKVSISDGASN